MRFTDEQRRAIAQRGSSLFLHAGAGSGKTAVLVERFVASVREGGARVDSILAITYTERAAAELKARIRRRFLAEGDRRHAREAERAWVSTIHGFCSRVLRAHALEAGLDPEYRVVEESEAARTARAAFESALEEFAAGGGAERLELLARYTPDKLSAMVRTVYGDLRSRGQREPSLPPVEGPRPAGREPAELAEAVSAALGELSGSGCSGKAVEAALRRLEGCRDALAGLGDELGQSADFEELRVKAGAARALKTEAFARLAEAHEAYVVACRAREAHRDYGLLRDLLAVYGRAYGEAKSARSALDFEDLELRCRDLLQRRPALRERYRDRFTQVMVDEFQDTNQLQNEILGLVARDNLFTVGDELQSIYSFRHADPGVFAAHREAAERELRAARLSANFRSAPELLDAMNAAFAAVDGFPLYPLRRPPAGDGLPAPVEGRLFDPDGPHAAQEPAVELLVVDRDKGRWDRAIERDGTATAWVENGAPAAPVWRTAEARLLAGRVREIVDGGAWRPGDVAVLLRSATDVAVYERALAQRGLPTYVVGGRGYWTQQQVADLRAYLGAVANPLDELALFTLLASPLVGASLDALVLLRLRAGALGRDPWWALESAFLDGDDGAGGLAAALPAPDREKLGRFVERFTAERAAAARSSLEALIDRAVTDSGYDRAVLALPAGGRRMANVRKLMRMAREFEAEHGRDVRGFIDFLDEQEGIEAHEGEAPLELEHVDAVRLMTIHAAKGLEFPVVCVADLGREGRVDDTALRVTEDGRAGLELASLGGRRSAGLDLERIKQEQVERTEREEKRVFYVAMTRAERRLILSGATDMEKWPEPKPLGAPMDWIWRAFAPSLAELVAEPAGEVERLSPDGRAVRVRYTVCAPHTIGGTSGAGPPGAGAVRNGAGRGPLGPPPAPLPLPDPSPVGVRRLSYSALEDYKRCGYCFYLERVLGVPEPLAVRAGAGRGPAEDPAARARPGEDELAPLVRGTVVHELLERLAFDGPVAPSAREVAARLERAGGVARLEEVDSIRSLIGGFIGSALCRRIAAARRRRQELPFAFGLPAAAPPERSLLLTGVVDVHVREGERTLIVDYKSDRLDGRAPEAVCREEYGLQRAVYALAALREGAPAVEVVHCFLERPEEPAAATFAPQNTPELEAELMAEAEPLLAGRFEPAGEVCPGCALRAAAWRVGGERPSGRRARYA